MNISNYVLKTRSRAMWQDPERKIRTLESFAQTETDGGENILQAAKHLVDPKLKKHFIRHGNEELHHGRLFKERARQLREQHPTLGIDDVVPDKMYDMQEAREHSNVDAHGFFSADQLEVVGEVPYVAMLYVAEKKAAAMFKIHSDLLKDDPETKAVFDEAFKDEKYHVAYTGAYLKKCREQGRNREVRDALSAAKGSRIVGTLKRVGIKSGAKFGAVVMYICYFTLIAPFGLLARFTRDKTGWSKPTPWQGERSVKSQF